MLEIHLENYVETHLEIFSYFFCWNSVKQFCGNLIDFFMQISIQKIAEKCLENFEKIHLENFPKSV